MSDWVLLLIAAVPLVIAELAAIAELATARSDLDPARRAGWIVALIVIPYVSLLAYAVVRPPRAGFSPMSATSPPEVDEMVTAVERHVAGQIDDVTYDEIVGRGS